MRCASRLGVMPDDLCSESNLREQKRQLDRERAREIKRKNPEMTYAQIGLRLNRSATIVSEWVRGTR